MTGLCGGGSLARACARAAIGWLVVGAAPAAATAATFTATGSEQTYTVPSGVTRVNVVAVGASGGAGSGVFSQSGGPGGRGALVAADLDVRPGQVLYVEVGTAGADAGNTPGVGGFNGGGTSETGGGGGGGSDVRTCSIGAPSCPAGFADSVHSRLLVAGGGGGGSGATSQTDGTEGGNANVVNGDPGTDGTATNLQFDGPGAGGGGGTEAAGGPGGGSGLGGPGDCNSNPPGGTGGFGTGGSGGSGSFQDGGSGGGGYWGGGAGGSGCESGVVPAVATGGGGGGGSSYGPAGTTFVGGVTQAPSVTIAPLPAPALRVSPGSLAFATQATSTVSAPRTVTLTNTGPGTLELSGVAVAGGNADDFFVGSSTCGGPLASGVTCELTVRFAPGGQGGRTATLQITSNDPGSPATVALSGAGGSLPQGPQGPAGTQGPAGKIELVTCKTVTRTVTRVIKHKRRKIKVTQQQCKTRIVSGTVKFTTSVGAIKASVSRGTTVYATGTRASLGGGRSQLLLTQSRQLRAGRYTLTLRSRRNGRTITRRETITITGRR